MDLEEEELEELEAEEEILHPGSAYTPATNRMGRFSFAAALRHSAMRPFHRARRINLTQYHATRSRQLTQYHATRSRQLTQYHATVQPIHPTSRHPVPLIHPISRDPVPPTHPPSRHGPANSPNITTSGPANSPNITRPGPANSPNITPRSRQVTQCHATVPPSHPMSRSVLAPPFCAPPSPTNTMVMRSSSSPVPRCLSRTMDRAAPTAYGSCSATSAHPP